MQCFGRGHQIAFEYWHHFLAATSHSPHDSVAIPRMGTYVRTSPHPMYLHTPCTCMFQQWGTAFMHLGMADWYKLRHMETCTGYPVCTQGAVHCNHIQLQQCIKAALCTLRWATQAHLVKWAILESSCSFMSGRKGIRVCLNEKACVMTSLLQPLLICKRSRNKRSKTHPHTMPPTTVDPP